MHAYPDDSTFELSLLAKCIHWGSHVEVPNINSISCSNSSLLECSPVTQFARVRFPAKTRLSRGALVEDGDDLGQVSSYYPYLRIYVALQGNVSAISGTYQNFNLFST